MDADISSMYRLSDYAVLTTNRNRHGGGVAVYISCKHQSSNIKHSLLETFIESLGNPLQGNIGNFHLPVNDILNLIKEKQYHDRLFFWDFKDLFQCNNDNVQEFLMYNY